MATKQDMKRRKSGKKKRRQARNRRIRRVVALLTVLLAVVFALLARSAAPSLAAIVWGVAAAVMLLDALLLCRRKALPTALYALVGLLCVALAAAGPFFRNYVPADGRYVSRDMLVTELKVTDAWPSGIAGMDRVVSLDMRDSTVTDFSPIPGLASLRSLDVRGNYAFTRAEHDAVASALPACDILWSVPVGDTHFDSDMQSVDLTTLDLAPAEIADLMDTYPDKRFTYTVTLMGRRYDADAETLDLTGGGADLNALEDALRLLPAVTRADLRGTPLSADAIRSLKERHPDIYFACSCDVPSGSMTTEDAEVTVNGGYTELLNYMSFIDLMPNLQAMDARSVQLTDEQLRSVQSDERCRKLLYNFTVFGRSVSTLETELNLDNTPISDVSEVERCLNCLPNLKKLSMVNCGLSDEQMGQLFDAHPDVKLVWEVHFGHYTLRTDATAFTTNLYASNPYGYTSGTFAPLRYCTDLMYLDIGHCKLTNIEGLAGLKKLRVLILADNHITDISPLAGLEDLEYVELFLNKIVDLTPLANKPHLMDLNIYYNSTITDLSPLATDTALERLWLGQCGFTDGQIGKIKKALPKCKVYSASSGSTEGGWRDHRRYKVIKKMNKTGQYVPFS